MPSLEIPDFEPTQLWLPDYERANLDAPIEAALTEMNALSHAETSELIRNLKKSVETDENGTVLAILEGDNPGEYSDTEAMVVFNPFGNTATKGQLVRCEFIRRAAKKANLVDEDGRYLPVIMLAAPGLGGSNMKLTKAELESIRNGELDIIGEKQLQAVEKRGYTTLAAKGFSEGGVIVLSLGKPSYNRGVDITSVTAGDPSNSVHRGRVELGKDLSQSKGKYFKESREYTGLTAQERANGLGLVEMGRFVLSVPNRINLASYEGLGVASFKPNVQRLVNDGKRLVVAYGGEGDAIANPSTMEPAIAQLYDLNGRDSFTSVKVDGANHTWDNRLTLLAKLYLL